MKSGLKKPYQSHKDYDFHKSYGTVLGAAQLPDTFNVDAGLWQPNQEAQNCLFSPCVPAMPFGCTNYGSADLCADEDGKLYNPMDLENVTHANALGGIDIRTALKATMQVWGRTAYFNIRSYGIIDPFDAMRLAMYSSQPEKRAVSLGIPWMQEFMQPVNGIVPMPATVDTLGIPWHNPSICGWKTIEGKPYLVVKPWIGTNYGDQGFCYFSREVFNVIMSINGSCAFTLSKVAPGQILTVDLSWTNFIVSYVRSLLGLS